jgi:hypothetical protein
LRHAKRKIRHTTHSRPSSSSPAGQDQDDQPDQEVDEALEEVDQRLERIARHAGGTPAGDLERLQGLFGSDTHVMAESAAASS